ncbi:hypothetical protein EYF80_042239 [Liparis tanakae]|uniref:Uncharacterized protein n=1 Tax=Liparis tanakae TaxID=230148 RepID=A0A4Z2G224_9TELE|nr:hypothetical protein EYF80_042239 [Liparis tanakae]
MKTSCKYPRMELDKRGGHICSMYPFRSPYNKDLSSLAKAFSSGKVQFQPVAKGCTGFFNNSMYVTVLLEWTQKHENRLGQNREISPKIKQVQKGAGQRVRGQNRKILRFCLPRLALPSIIRHPAATSHFSPRLCTAAAAGYICDCFLPGVHDGWRAQLPIMMPTDHRNLREPRADTMVSPLGLVSFFH